MRSDLKRIAALSKASQNVEELEFLLGRVDEIKPKVILEIGVDQGHSIRTWLSAFDPELVIGVEIAEFGSDLPGNVEIVVGDSGSGKVFEEVKQILDGRMVDFLFIDGDHRYDVALGDWELYSRLVRSGGIIAIHDVGLEGEKWRSLVETKRLFEELCETHGKHASLHAQGGTGVGLIYKK